MQKVVKKICEKIQKFSKKIIQTIIRCNQNIFNILPTEKPP